ncbi:MAG: hypothetical protein ACN6OU_14500 [Stenotrophomonas acidaminiphila]
MYDKLPDGFEWQVAWQYGTALTDVAFDGIVVCVLLERINDGGWYAWLDRHRTRIEGQLGVFRDCRSYESGVAGCSAWVHRHQERLRREAGAMAEAARMKNNYGRSWSGQEAAGGALSAAMLSAAPSDPMSYRGDSRSPEEKAAAYSRELRRRRGGRRNWHLNGSGATDRP